MPGPGLAPTSETPKEQVYSFLAGVGAYCGAEAELQLREHTDLVLAEVGDLQDYTVGIQPISRSLSAVRDVDSYVAVWVNGLIDDYYPSQAAERRDQLRWIRAVEFTLAVAAVVLAVTAGNLGGGKPRHEYGRSSAGGPSTWGLRPAADAGRNPERPAP